MSGAATPTTPGPTPARLFGRDDDLARLAQLLVAPAVRLVTLSGPGGVGKTRLAMALATMLADRPAPAARCDVVALADVDDAGLILPTIVRALGIEVRPGQTAEQALTAGLHGPRLLVLDNLEHLAAAPMVSSLLATCPELQILTTSRIAVGVEGEHEYPLASLPVPAGDAAHADESPAVQLFVDRVRLVLPAFQLAAGQLADVVDICRAVDRFPLAIELAAAQCRQLAPHALAGRLREHATLGTAAWPGLPERHQTMHATVTWSVALLEPDVAMLWRCLGVFEGGFAGVRRAVVGGAHRHRRPWRSAQW